MVSSSRAAAGSSPAPYAGKVVVPEGAAHGYELLEQLTALPQRPQDGRLPGLRRIGSGRTAAYWQPSDWGDDHAVAQRWLAADAGSSSSIEGFCAADLHPATSHLQLGPAASALVEVLAGLPMRIEQDSDTAASAAGQLSAAAQAPPPHRHKQSSMHDSDAQELRDHSQELRDYSLQDSFARGHFGEGQGCHVLLTALQAPWTSAAYSWPV